MHVMVYMTLLDMQQQSKIMRAGHCWNSRTKSERQQGKEKTTPLGVKLMRSQDLYRAAQVQTVKDMHTMWIMRATALPGYLASVLRGLRSKKLAPAA